MPTEHIKYDDVLREGTDKLNKAIDQANKAEVDSEEALTTANQALQNSESTQTQLDTIVIEGDSSVEAAQARVDADGNAYTTLKERLDTEHTEVTAQLTDIAVNVKSFGAVGDGITINTTALKNAIESDEASVLLFPAGTYVIDAPVVATVKGKRKWITNGNVIFKYANSDNGKMIELNLNGSDFEVEGDFTFDCDNLARQGLEVNNNVATMDNAVHLYMKGVKVKNVYSSTEGYGSNGIVIKGGFQLIRLVDCGATDVSRAQGVGIVGSQGSNGIAITHDGVNAYPRQVIIDNPQVENITSEELDGSAENTDCDGISVFAPTDLNGEVMHDSVLLVEGGIYKDCRGRSVKSQMAFTSINNPTFIRNSNKTITNGTEVDFQYGMGTLKNFRCLYDNNTAFDTIFGASFSLVKAGVSGRTDNAGNILIRQGEIINNVDAIYPVPYLVTLTSSTSVTFSDVTVKDIKHFGAGRIGRVVRSTDLSNVKRINIKDSYFSWLATSLINSANSASSTSIFVEGVHHTKTEIPVFEGAGIPQISAKDNTGFEGNLRSRGVEFSSDGIRTSKIIAKDARDGGGFAIESFVLNDEETVLFSRRGTGNNNALYFLSSSFNERVMGVFGASGSSIDVLAEPTSTLVSYGTSGTNPDVDGNLNIWATNEGIQVKNRLGSARYITLASIG